MPFLVFCCCGCSVKFGTYIILFFNLLGSTYYAVAGTGVAELTDLQEFIARWLNIVFVIVIVVAFYGACTNSPKFLIPYLIWDALYTVGMLFFGVTFIMISNKVVLIIVGLLLIFGAIPAAYFWLVVLSYYQELREK